MRANNHQERNSILSARERKSSPWVRALKVAGGVTAAAAGGWTLYSYLKIDHSLPLMAAIPAERVSIYGASAGRLNLYMDRQGSGRPLVLIHSVNAAASAFEMRPLFQYFRDERPVYALDLPGYGFSERTNRVYNPEMFADAILTVLESQVKEPADVVALSLGSEFAARAALKAPEAFHSLVLISPSGLGASGSGRASQKLEPEGNGSAAYQIFSFPLVAQPFFDLLVTRPSIEYFLKQSFVGPVPQDLIDYAYSTAHQPGAKNVPLYFISGMLFTPEVRTRIYEKVRTPTLVIYDRDAFVSFEMLADLLAKNSAWRAERVTPTRGLPHFEMLKETALVMSEFWETI